MKAHIVQVVTQRIMDDEQGYMGKALGPRAIASCVNQMYDIMDDVIKFSEANTGVERLEQLILDLKVEMEERLGSREDFIEWLSTKDQ